MTFLDTNVCLDLLAKRSPWHNEAETLINWHINNSQKIAISVISVPMLSYLLKRYNKSINIKHVLQDLFQFAELLTVTDEMVKVAVSKSWNDIEDAIQHHCALTNQANCIITRNEKDFNLSEIPVFNPVEWIEEFVE